MQNLSSRLEQARKNAQLTRDEVVQLASQTSGFSRSSLQDWEQEGNTREPKLEYLLDLARIYGIHPWTLMSGEVLTTDHSLESMADIESLALNNLTNEPSNRNFPVPKWWLDERDLQVSQLVGYIYQGDTMSPTIANHAIIIVDKLQKQLIDGAHILKKCITLFLVLQAQDRFKKMIHSLRPDFFAHCYAPLKYMNFV